jgi:hypothetical protein
VTRQTWSGYDIIFGSSSDQEAKVGRKGVL